MLLFLCDVGPSLQGALQVLNSFSPVYGLKVNWTKSLLSPIDPAAQATAPPDLYLQWADQFKYLGVVIYHQASDLPAFSLSLVTGC